VEHFGQGAVVVYNTQRSLIYVSKKLVPLHGLPVACDRLPGGGILSLSA
jgi:hypothetical protein